VNIDICCIFAVETRRIIDIITSRNMKAILGQYYYAPHRRSFGVWQWTEVSENCACGTFIKDFRSKEEAREYVWQMNGWGKPSKKLN
jgi:hypothetical protein